MHVDNNGSWNTGYQTFAHSLCQLSEINDYAYILVLIWSERWQWSEIGY